MDDSAAPNNDWIQQWIEQQRALLRERSAQQQAGATTDDVHQQLLTLGTKWLDIGQAYLIGLQQFTDTTSRLSPDTGRAVFELGGELLSAWQSQWQSLIKAKPVRSDSTATWEDLLRQFPGMGQFPAVGQLPAMGLMREHTLALRELAQAHAQYQRLEQALHTMLYGVQTEALSLVERRVRERQAGPGKLGFRDLYDLWVECGEQAYAQVAHSDAYCQLQAELGNAAIQLRAHHQQLIEHALKQLDLPTRTELNSMHRQLRDQARTLRDLQAQLAAQAAGRSEDS